ncbi:MAG: hypothetical protein IJ506_08415 [Clostridia bacterium]|nr:hypothetical protein [Clostridia bacterium]
MKRKVTLWLLTAMFCLCGGGLIACDDGDGQNNSSGGNSETVTCTHDYKLEGTVEATCVKDGAKTYKCSKCEDTYSETLVKTGHNYGEWTQTKDPDCAQDGEKQRTCSICNVVETDYVASLPHTYIEMLTENSSCTEQGYVVYVCEECEDTYTTYQDALGHTPTGEGEVTAAKCLEDGYTTYHCSVCNEDYTEVIEKLGHNYQKTSAVAATCDNFGYNVETCQNCQDIKHVYAAQKLEHTFDDSGVCEDCKLHITDAMLFNTKDGKNFSFVEKSADYGYVVNAIDNTYFHKLIISRATIDALIQQSITGFKMEFGCPDTTWRAFGYKTADMIDYSYYNVFQQGYGGTAKFEIEFAPKGVLNEEMVTSEGLVIDVLYRANGNATEGVLYQDEGTCSDYALSVGYNISYNEKLPATWISSELEVSYDGSKWELFKSSGVNGFVNIAVQAGAIEKWMESGVTKLTFTVEHKTDKGMYGGLSLKSPQVTANGKISFTIDLTEEMKETGYTFNELYVSDYFGKASNATVKCDGFYLTVSPVKAFNISDASTWLIAEDMTFTQKDATITFTGKATGGHATTFSKEWVAYYLDKGVTSLTFSFASKDGELSSLASTYLTGGVNSKGSFTLTLTEAMRTNGVNINFWYYTWTAGWTSEQEKNPDLEIVESTGFVLTITETVAE